MTPWAPIRCARCGLPIMEAAPLKRDEPVVCVRCLEGKAKGAVDRAAGEIRRYRAEWETPTIPKVDATP